MAKERDSKPFEVGKLPAEFMEDLLGVIPRHDGRLLVGPRLGEDAAVLDFGDRCLVVASDPVTFAAEKIGQYAVHINANDVAVMGARPRWFSAVILFPEHGTTATTVKDIFDDIAATCEKLGVAICGGHTEVTSGLDRPIVIGQMLGETDSSRIVRKDSLQIGDHILMTRGVAIEGTAILARERVDLLRAHMPASELRRAERFLFEPGISVVDAALTAVDAGRVHAMHDPTEGGVISALFELAAASGRGLHVFGDRVPVFSETKRICEILEIDPLRLIASGSLLIGVPACESDAIIAALAAKNIPTSIIAEVRGDDGERSILELHGKLQTLVPPERDEIAKVVKTEK